MKTRMTYSSMTLTNGLLEHSTDEFDEDLPMDDDDDELERSQRRRQPNHPLEMATYLREKSRSKIGVCEKEIE